MRILLTLLLMFSLSATSGALGQDLGFDGAAPDADEQLCLGNIAKNDNNKPRRFGSFDGAYKCALYGEVERAAISVLSKNCSSCHQAAVPEQYEKAGLDLPTTDPISLLQFGDGDLIDCEVIEDSEIYRRVFFPFDKSFPQFHMPFRAEGREDTVQLSQDDADTLLEWLRYSCAERMPPVPIDPYDGPKVVMEGGFATLQQQSIALVVERCGGCHANDSSLRDGEYQNKAGGGITFSVVSDLVNSAPQYLIRPGDPKRSAIMRQIHAKEMPKAPGKPLTEDEVALLTSWIDCMPRDYDGTQDVACGGDVGEVADLEEVTDVPGFEFVTVSSVLRDISRDLESIPVRRRFEARYVTLTHLYNSGSSPPEMDNYRAGLARGLNSVSTQATMAKLVPVDANATVYRFFLSDLGWTQQDWADLMREYPYRGLPYQDDVVSPPVRIQPLADEIASLIHEGISVDDAYYNYYSESAPVLARADWLIRIITHPGRYEYLLRQPDSLEGLEQKIGVNPLRNIEFGEDGTVRGGFPARGSGWPDSSGVSAFSRIIERHSLDSVRGGYYWKSYDFGPANSGNTAVPSQPLTPAELDPSTKPNVAFRHDGGEMVYSLPNGLQAYFITTVAGTPLPSAPNDIVNLSNDNFAGQALPVRMWEYLKLGLFRNPEAPETPIAATADDIFNGLSCMACHAEGMKTNFDSVGAFFSDLGSPIPPEYSPRDLDLIISLYNDDALQGWFKQDKKQFAAAVIRAYRAIGLAEDSAAWSSLVPGDGVVAAHDPVTTLARQHERNIKSFDEEYEGALRRLAAEYWLTPEVFERASSSGSRRNMLTMQILMRNPSNIIFREFGHVDRPNEIGDGPFECHFSRIATELRWQDINLHLISALHGNVDICEGGVASPVTDVPDWDSASLRWDTLTDSFSGPGTLELAIPNMLGVSDGKQGTNSIEWITKDTGAPSLGVYAELTPSTNNNGFDEAHFSALQSRVESKLTADGWSSLQRKRSGIDHHVVTGRRGAEAVEHHLYRPGECRDYALSLLFTFKNENGHNLRPVVDRIAEGVRLGPGTECRLDVSLKPEREFTPKGWIRATRNGYEVEYPSYLGTTRSRTVLDSAGVYIGDAFGDDLDLTFSFVSFDFSGAPIDALRQQWRDLDVAVTYEVDRTDVGVLSGFVGRGDDLVIYGACRPGGTQVGCFEITFPASARTEMDAVVTRMFRSFAYTVLESKGHPYAGEYSGYRGYTDSGRPSPNKNCLSEYRFVATIDSNGEIKFESDGRVWTGTVSSRGVIRIERNGVTPRTSQPISVRGSVEGAEMKSGYCGQGYFSLDVEHTLNPVGPDYFVFLGSFSAVESARVHNDKLRALGLDAFVIDTDDYEGGAPNLVSVVIGGFTRQDAARALEMARQHVPDAFVRQLVERARPAAPLRPAESVPTVKPVTVAKPAPVEKPAPVVKPAPVADAAPVKADPWSCVALSIIVAETKPNGKKWDVTSSLAKPDTRIYDSISGYKLASKDCDQSYSCNVRFTPKGDHLNLTITDKDAFADDLIGKGTCPLVEGICRLGQATVGVKRC